MPSSTASASRASSSCAEGVSEERKEETTGEETIKAGPARGETPSLIPLCFVFSPSSFFSLPAAVAILVILECEGAKWVVCCRQPRVPVGRSDYLEIPAGMLDDSGHFAGVAAKVRTLSLARWA